MDRAIFLSDGAVTLVGAGGVATQTLQAALSLAPRIVAADGGADVALGLGAMPEAVIGDLDSLSTHARKVIAPDRVHQIAEQDSTDFDKALRSIRAPLVLGVGFDGDRMDHMLSCFNTLARRSAQACVLLTRAQLVFLCPPELTLDLPRGSLVSLFPLAPVTGRSEGLEWPIDGLAFAPEGRVGTSNQVSADRVRLWMDRPAMLVILPLIALPKVAEALLKQAGWGKVQG